VRRIRTQYRSFAAAAGSVLDHLKGFLNAQRAADLARRLFLERQKKSTHDVDAGNHRPEFVAPPARIHHRLVPIALPRILPQVGHERDVGGFLRPGKQIALDGLEAEFPVLVSQGMSRMAPRCRSAIRRERVSARLMRRSILFRFAQLVLLPGDIAKRFAVD